MSGSTKSTTSGSAAGGPRIVQVLEFASARAPELQALLELSQHPALQSPADAKLSAQFARRRRRANAFKSHRLPRRLRQQREVSTAGAPGDGTERAEESKPRCRTHTRRPHLLVAARSWAATKGGGAGSSKEERAVWLPTHVWHSKRMKMVERYGLALAAHRADKSVSASLDALRSKATLHDVSYLGVLELFGLPQLILEALQLVSDPAGSDFHGMRFLAGADEGQSVLYHENQFPAGALSPVTFMWRPLEADSRSVDAATGSTKFELKADWQETKRQLWLWIHPAAFMEAAGAIARACQAVVDGSDDEIQVLDRRGQFCRFQLRGKLADEMLGVICRESPSSQQESAASDSNSVADADSDHEDGFRAPFVAKQCGSTNLALLRERLRSSSVPRNKQVSPSVPGRIYSVTAADPRATTVALPRAEFSNLSLLREPGQSELARAEEIRCPVSHEPLTLQGKDADEPDSALILKKLSKILSWTSTPSSAAGSLAATYPFVSPLEALQSSEPIEEESAMQVDEDSASLIPCSYLWSKTKRQVLEGAFEKDHELNDKRYRERQNRFLTSSESASASTAAVSSKLHMLAIEKRGPFNSTSGWDLILTPTFAPAMLKALVFAGALVVGLDENDALSTVLEQPCFPRDFPDTLAGESLWQTEAEAQQAEHLRKPKAKRFLYEKDGVESPFQPNWKQLFPASETRADEAGEVDDDEDDGDAEVEDAVCVLRGEQYMQPFCFFKPRDGGAGLSSNPPKKIPVTMRTLVRVVLRVPGRGSLEANTMLYAPSASDIKSFYEQKKWRGVQVSDTQAPERLLAGFVTSAVYDRPKGTFRATGFCACEPLQDVFLTQLDKVKTQEALVMVRAPRGKMYRPALVRSEA